ncbi:unnamed protein product [Amoebophrya sp. A120]|nr:unnamed protein product [Amoebophrya sp. A120]|eukprot:GSA120T00014880001.1
MFKVVSAPSEDILRGLRAVVPDDEEESVGNGTGAQTQNGSFKAVEATSSAPSAYTAGDQGGGAAGSRGRASDHAEDGRSLSTSSSSSSSYFVPIQRPDLAAMEEFLQNTCGIPNPQAATRASCSTTDPTMNLNHGDEVLDSSHHDLVNMELERTLARDRSNAAVTSKLKDHSAAAKMKSQAGGGPTSSTLVPATTGGVSTSSGNMCTSSSSRSSGKNKPPPSRPDSAASSSRGRNNREKDNAGPADQQQKSCFNVTRDFKSVEHMKRQAEELRRLADEAVARVQGMDGRPPPDQDVRIKRLSNIYGNAMSGNSGSTSGNKANNPKRPATPSGLAARSTFNTTTFTTTAHSTTNQGGCSSGAGAPSSSGVKMEVCGGGSSSSSSTSSPGKINSQELLHNTNHSHAQSGGSSSSSTSNPQNNYGSRAVKDNEQMAHFFTNMQKELEEKISKLEGENRKLKSRVGAMQAERQALQTSGQQSVRTMQVLQERVQEGEKKLAAEKKKCDGLERRCRLLENREAGLLTELQTACEEVDSLSARVSESKDRESTNSVEVDQYKLQSHALQSDNARLQKTVAILREELARKEQRIQKFLQGAGAGEAGS